MESAAVIQPPDFSSLANGQQTLHYVSVKAGRNFHPSDLSAAVKLGHIKPLLVAGRKMYYLPDLDAFAKKWGERKVMRAEAAQ